MQAPEMRPVVPRETARQRLEVIFPRAAFDTVMSSPLAASAVAAMIYVDAIAGPDADAETTTWARPSTVTWLADAVLDHHTSQEDRSAWRAAAARSRSKVTELLEAWGLVFETAYADNSRETLRDETFKKWREAGAIRKRAGVPTASSKPTWALEPHFADLFAPDLTGPEFEDAAQAWREAHMSTSANLKTAVANFGEQAKHAVTVTLPTVGGTRTLEPGIASQILKGIIEEWAPARMGRPVVLSISEPGDKLFVGDQNLLAFLKITINVSKLLPDAVLADVDLDPVRFWIIEAVNTDGEINNPRKLELLDWATRQGIAPDQCSFLTGFRSRNDPAARRRLKDLATDTYAWFLDEPGLELSWHQITTHRP